MRTLFFLGIFFSSSLWAATQFECTFSELKNDALLSGQSSYNKNIEFHASTNSLNRINVAITDNATQVSALNSVRNEKSALVALDKGGLDTEMYRLECLRK